MNNAELLEKHKIKAQVALSSYIADVPGSEKALTTQMNRARAYYLLVWCDGVERYSDANPALREQARLILEEYPDE